MNPSKLSIALILTATLCGSCATDSAKKESDSEKTAFQIATPWRPTMDNRADVAIIYGAGDYPDITFEERVNTWRERGYDTHFMTGIAWGNYGEYFSGQWDGVNHFDEGQVVENGDTLWHGKPVPYLVPTKSFLEYFKERHIKRVIDAGIDAIYLEEPEFWARAGYSDAFKREWKDFYGFDWRPQHESAENTYLSNKLKYHLYYRALDEAFTYAKEYGRSKGIDVRCYVPTHSLVNYTAWQIVSPEASLASLSCIDGYIAQVWTGTSRVENFFNGKEKERVFENAYLEYGSMESMTEPTGRKLFFLTDPIEDWQRDWDDYKKNYQATFTAQLLYPRISNYEVMPWPDRIYEGRYLNPETGQKERIPRFYSTQIQVMINALNHMPVSDNKVSGSDGICVMMSNSLMFQRSPNDNGYDDPAFSSFYGQTLPLVKRGVPVKTMHLENVKYPETWKDAKVLILSYYNMKPLEPEAHKHIADWVKKGGALLFCGTDTDPYQTVQEWWNTGENKYTAPSQHLFEMLGIDKKARDSKYKCGKGTVVVMRQDPKDFVLSEGGDSEFIANVTDLYENHTKAGKLQFKNSFSLKRGPFEIISVMDENEDSASFVTEGLFIDLFNPQLPVITHCEVTPGNQAFLYNIASVENKKKPQVLASASRITDEIIGKGSYQFTAKGPIETNSVIRVLLPDAPVSTTITDSEGKVVTEAKAQWDEASMTSLISFENNPDGVGVKIEF